MSLVFFNALSLNEMKKLALLYFVLLAWGASAQQDHQYTQFMYNKLLLNPAYAGARGVPTVSGIYRNQWYGFEGAPQSALASFNSPFLSNRVGVGAVVSMQSAGLFRDFSGSLAYAYDLVANDQFSFRAGIQASVRSLSINFGNAITGDPGGPTIDPSLTNQRTNDIYGNVGAGLYATYAQRLYMGFSVPRIYTNTIGINPDPNVETAKESRHFYLMAGAILPINEDLKLLPAVLAKYVQGAPFDADLNINLDIREKFTVGLSGRLGGNRVFETDALLGVESVDLIAFWQVSPLVGVGAAYDFTLSKVRDYTAGSFELLVQADLKTVTKKNSKSRKNLSNPRFFL